MNGVEWMNSVYTIGFTKKSAQDFFELLEVNKIDVVLDVRLKNTSQLAGFSRYPDIEYFLKKIHEMDYISDTLFAPTEEILKNYKNKLINWDEYVCKYNKLMDERKIENHIAEEYGDLEGKRICLLCSEEKADHCHRRLVAERFMKIFEMKIVNL